MVHTMMTGILPETGRPEIKTRKKTAVTETLNRGKCPRANAACPRARHLRQQRFCSERQSRMA